MRLNNVFLLMHSSIRGDSQDRNHTLCEWTGRITLCAPAPLREKHSTENNEEPHECSSLFPVDQEDQVGLAQRRGGAENDLEMSENEIGTIVLEAAIHVHRELGPGLLETVTR
jgi:hypothetical protein